MILVTHLLLSVWLQRPVQLHSGPLPVPVGAVLSPHVRRVQVPPAHPVHEQERLLSFKSGEDVVVAREDGPDALVRVVVQKLLHSLGQVWEGAKTPRSVHRRVRDDELVLVGRVYGCVEPLERLVYFFLGVVGRLVQSECKQEEEAHIPNLLVISEGPLNDILYFVPNVVIPNRKQHRLVLEVPESRREAGLSSSPVVAAHYVQLRVVSSVFWDVRTVHVSCDSEVV